MKKAHILSGIDRIDLAADKLAGRRVGLMTNPTGVDHTLRSTIDIVADKFNLTALFAVEHGIRGDIQAGKHVESVVCLSREKAYDYIRISVHTEDLKAKAN